VELEGLQWNKFLYCVPFGWRARIVWLCEKCHFDTGVCCTEFSKGLCFKVVHEGQNMIINFISHLREEESASFSLNMVLVVNRHLKSINLPYGVVGMDGCITYVCDSIAHSTRKFICTWTQGPFFYEPLKGLAACWIPFNNWSEYHMLQ